MLALLGVVFAAEHGAAAPAVDPIGVRASDRMLLLGGRPFLPLGTFEAPGGDSALARLARAGFNLCQLPAGPVEDMRSVLDRVQVHGLRAWFGLGELLDFSRDSLARREALIEIVRNAGTHPALLMWEGVDEPVWTRRDADGYLAGYRFLHTLDPRRPVWTNHAPRNTVAQLAHWNRATDIGGADIYPVPEPQVQSNLPNRTIAVVGDECDKNIAAVGARKPILMVLQGFGWEELTRAPGHAVSARMPTMRQSRFMAYDALVHGANGLLWWGTQRTQKPSRFWSELQTVVRELADLQEALASESVRGAGAASLLAPVRGVRVMHKRVGAHDVVIVVNEHAGAVTARLAVPGWRGASIPRLFDGGSLPVTRDGIRVPLAGYDVAVLADDARLEGRRVDFTLTQDQPSRAPAPSRAGEPGNLVGNPGFEIDADDDRVPDEWDASVPLATTLSDDAHGGRHAFALSGMGVTITPLVVQRGTPLRGGRTYRFRAWFKAPRSMEGRVYAEWELDGVFHSQSVAFTPGTGAWRELDFTFKAEPDPAGAAYVVAQVRGRGTALFDDLRLEDVSPAR